jgi:hypothetical protein
MAAWRMVEDGGRLRIEHPSRTPLTVAVEGWRFVVRTAEREVGRFSFLDVREVGRRASEVLRHAGRAEPYTLALDAAAVPHPMVIAGRLLGTRERLLAAVDPRVRAVWDRLAPLTRQLPQLVCAEALYRDPWIVRDVLRYAAAAVALAFVETTLRPPGLLWDATTPAGEAALVDALRDWRGLFSPSGRSYRSLDRTLMRLAPGVAGELLCRLRRLELARPYTDPIELTAILVADAAYERTDRREVAATHLRAVMLASGAEIAAAVRRVGDALGECLNPRRVADLRRAFAIVADFPDPHRGRLLGLVERALRWHRVAPDLRTEVAALGGATMPTRRPPVPLPDDPRITFLSTVGAVLEEGDRMRHCVGSYARRAATGGCYLFHVDYRGEQATVEVDQGGGVSQSCGPCNQRNAATAWGKRQLGKWGLDLMPEATRRRLRLRMMRRPRRREQPRVEQLSLFPTP